MALLVVVALTLSPHSSGARPAHWILYQAKDERIARLGPVVTRVEFAGNETFSADELTEFMATRPSGFFRKYHLDRVALERDISNLRHYHGNQGFLEAEVYVEDVSYSPDGREAGLLIVIDQGRRWMVERVSFEGNNVLPDRQLAELISVSAGSPLLSPDLATDRKAILDEYARRSYLDARVSQDVIRDDDLATAVIEYRVVERDRASIGSIDIRGRDKTRGFVVERELTVEEGDLFNPQAVGETQANLYRTGLFYSVWVHPAQADTGKAIKSLVIGVSERPSGVFDLGFGYAAIDGPRARMEIANRNVQGQATEIGFAAGYGRLRREVELSLRDPWFFGRRVTGQGLIGYAWADEKSYVGETVEGSLVLTKDLTKALTLEGGYELKRAVILESREGNEATGVNYTSSLTGAVTYDRRDNVLSTTRGVFARGEVDFASSRLGGTNDFVRSELQIRGFHRMPGSTVGGAALVVGWIRTLGDEADVPIDERYFSGGEGSVRGFERNSLGPLNVAGELVGGRALLELRLELRFPVRSALGGVAFADAGQAYKDLSSVDASDLAIGLGAGLRYATRIGVFRLDVAFPATDPPSADRKAHYYFSVGQAF